MVNYNIIDRDMHGEPTESYFIIGGHINKEQALRALQKRGFINENDDVQVSEIEHIWAKRITNMCDINPEAVSNLAYEFLYEPRMAPEYRHRVTRVVLIDNNNT